MAVENRKSNLVTNADASPVTFNKSWLDGGVLREKVSVLEAVSGDSADSVYRMFRVRSNWRVSELLLSADDIGTTTAADVGVYRTAADGGAVVDADLFGSAVSLSGGAISDVNVAHESGVYDISESEKQLWELLGLSEDPGLEYDLALTLTGAADAAGTIVAKLRYSDGY